MKNLFSSICLMTVMIFCAHAHCITKARLSSKWLSPGHSIVSVINTIEPGQIGHEIPVTLSNVSSTGPELTASRYWPEIGETVTAVGPNSEDKSGLSVVAEFSRYSGIKKGATYDFTETVELPGICYPVEFKQRIEGTWRGTHASIGIAIPSLGIQKMFSDNQWRQIRISHKDDAGNFLGSYVISFCFYYRESSIRNYSGQPLPALASGSTVRKVIDGLYLAGLTALGCGVSEVAAAAWGRGPTLKQAAVEMLDTAYVCATNEDVVYTTIGVVAVTGFALAALNRLYVWARYANIVYKVDYEKYVACQ